MALMFIHNTEHQKFSYEQPSLQDTLCNGLECVKLYNEFMKINTYGNTLMEGIVTFTMFPARI